MRKHYVLDAARRRARAPDGDAAGEVVGGVEGDAAGDATPGGGRRRTWVLIGALACVALGGAAIGWLGFAPPEAPVAAPAMPVPEHQRSGPLANPWGNAPPVNATRAEEAAGSASAAMAGTGPDSAASAASGVSATAAGGGADAASPARAVPPGREALRQALARLRGTGKAAEFVVTALQGGDTAALTVAWMAERQCRQTTHWRQMIEWRTRATQERAPAGAGLGPGEAKSCDAMPESGLVESALSAAGFPASADAALELTRRPIDFALAVAVGDPLLLAEVLEASDGDRIGQQLQAWGADTRDLISPDVQRGAIWLASCLPLDATGRPGTSAALKPACRDHPALRQACMNQGLCDARDVRDLLLRTLPANELGAAERVARWLAPRMR